LDDYVSNVFARCPTFTIVDVVEGEIKSVKAVPNPVVAQPRGAGVAAVQFLVSVGAKIAIAGRFGPWAAQASQQMGLKLVAAYGLRVREAVERYVIGK